MATFVLMTQIDGSAMYVNPEYVVAVRSNPDDEGSSCIIHLSGGNAGVVIQGTVSEIVDLVERAGTTADR